MSIWFHILHFTVLYSVSSLHILKAETLLSLKHDNACSSRPDGRCVRCDGVPECFDLSDETGCGNTTVKFIPIQQAVQKCHKSSCLNEFPEPPPLPPFSLCDGKQKITTHSTTSTPITTKQTVPATTSLPITTEQTAPVTTTTPITTEQTAPVTTSTPITTEQTAPVTTKATTKTTSSQVTYYPSRTTWQFRPTTKRIQKSTWWWPVFTTSTATPVRPTTRRIPTTTPINDKFMKLWRHCASCYHDNRDILYCTLCGFVCSCCRRCPACVSDVYHTHCTDPVQPAPITTESSIFNPVPTRLFPTYPPTTWSPVPYTDTLGFQDYSNSNEMTGQDLVHFYWLRSIFNK